MKNRLCVGHDVGNCWTTPTLKMPGVLCRQFQLPTELRWDCCSSTWAIRRSFLRGSVSVLCIGRSKRSPATARTLQQSSDTAAAPPSRTELAIRFAVSRDGHAFVCSGPGSITVSDATPHQDTKAPTGKFRETPSMVM